MARVRFLPQEAAPERSLVEMQADSPFLERGNHERLRGRPMPETEVATERLYDPRTEQLVVSPGLLYDKARRPVLLTEPELHARWAVQGGSVLPAEPQDIVRPLTEEVYLMEKLTVDPPAEGEENEDVPFPAEDENAEDDENNGEQVERKAREAETRAVRPGENRSAAQEYSANGEAPF